MITSEIKGRSKDFVIVTFKHGNKASNGEAHRVAHSFISSTAGTQGLATTPHIDSCIPMIIEQ
jgi:hypothetical protein